MEDHIEAHRFSNNHKRSDEIVCMNLSLKKKT